LEPVDVVDGLAEMRMELLLELRIMRILDHVGQRLHDLMFRVIDVAQPVHEQIVDRLDVAGEETHGRASPSMQSAAWKPARAPALPIGGSTTRPVRSSGTLLCRELFAAIRRL